MHNFEAKKREILDRVDILGVVTEHVSLKHRGKRWVGLCPFHSEKTPSFTVTPDLGLFKCFGCGKGGDVFSFVQYRENVPFIEAMQVLADRAGVDLVHAKGTGNGGPTRASLARVNDWALRFFRANLLDESTGRSAREYLASRQVSDETQKSFKLGLALDGYTSLCNAAKRGGIDQSLLLAADLVRQSEGGRVYDTFRSRLMFPIQDPTGRVIGFGGRTLTDDPAKYLNTRQNLLFDKGRNLYGVNLARDAISRKGQAVIVEGYTDCTAAHQAGFLETVATLGTALTESQVDMLRRYCDEVVLLFDSDDAGEQAAERALLVALPRCIKVRMARIPEGKDPSDYLAGAGREAFSDVLNRAIGALEFKWIQTRRRFSGDGSDAGRRDAVLDFLKVIAEAGKTKALDAIQRGLMVNQVAHLLQIDRREVDRLLTGLQRTSSVGRPEEIPGAVSRRHSLPTEEQAAWAHLLEVVLNEPGVLESVNDMPDVARIASQRDRRIAKNVMELAQQVGEFRLIDVLGRCSDPSDAERIEELARRGAAKGNYVTNLEVALERIRRASSDKEMELGKKKYTDAETEPASSDGVEGRFRTFVSGAREHRHFIPRGRRRDANSTGVDRDPADDLAKMEQP
ncbi:MAG: DNA primase [Phycisphaerales bacterium]|nr:MAG: DNA primase [Phycisphaerales bacterium]